MNNLTKLLGIILGCLVCFPGLARTSGDPVTVNMAPLTGQAAYVVLPPNDSCQFAVVLTPGITCAPTAGTTIGAGPSRPAITCNGATGTANDDVWYRFTATATNHTVTVSGDAGFNAVVDVLSGSCNGTTIACADATGLGGTETVVLSGLTIGATYIVRVYSFGSGTSTNGTFNICVTTPIPPPNDNCVNAVTLTPGQTCIPVAGSTFFATQSLPPGSCGTFGSVPTDDVWYRFTAEASTQIVTVDGAANMDAVVEVRTGACPGSFLACRDATFADGTETITLTGLTVGATYLVRVYDFFANGGDFSI